MFEDVAHFLRSKNGTMKFLGECLRPIGVVVVIVGDINSIQPCYGTGALEALNLLDDLAISAIDQKSGAGLRYDKTRVCDWDDPFRQLVLNLFRHRHPVDRRRSENASG